MLPLRREIYLLLLSTTLRVRARAQKTRRAANRIVQFHALGVARP